MDQVSEEETVRTRTLYIMVGFAAQKQGFEVQGLENTSCCVGRSNKQKAMMHSTRCQARTSHDCAQHNIVSGQAKPREDRRSNCAVRATV